MELPIRKSNRLPGYDYNTPGYYFITFCTKDRKELLSTIAVGAGILDGPQHTLTVYGKVAEKHIQAIGNHYPHIRVDKYVIMPNHIHLLLHISALEDGPSGTPVPTLQNAIVSRFVSTFKRFCNKEYGENIWQPRFYDHIVRGEKDYREIWEYIDTNPLRWQNDRFFSGER